eukprot:357704-Chlamydomonas_euryale.AAC.3
MRVAPLPLPSTCLLVLIPAAGMVLHPSQLPAPHAARRSPANAPAFDAAARPAAVGAALWASVLRPCADPWTGPDPRTSPG